MSTVDPRSSNYAAPQTGGVRFAPSPTGRFHVGNLRTAWISWKFAKALNIPWVVRYEDIDRPRVLAGAQEFQASDMRELGMRADFTLIQSTFYPRHLELFERARAEGAIYACDCSRKDVLNALAGMSSAPNDGHAPAYSGNCRHRGLATVGGPAINPGIMSLAWRMKMPREDGQDDVIIARTSTDGQHFVPAYHWACAIDDFDGAYDLLVRSSDLAHALVIQRGIQTWLMKSHGITREFPRVFHTALITQNDGHRLEKRTLGVTLEELAARGILSEQLLSIFENSFDSNLLRSAFVSDLTLAESAETLTLSELGL